MDKNMQDKREAAARARRLASNVSDDDARWRILKFAADLEAQADKSESAKPTRPQ